MSFDQFIEDNSNYIRQIVDTYHQRFGCVLLCFYTLAINCYVFTNLPVTKKRIGHYRPHKTSLKVSGIDFPMSPKQISLFEDQNPEISINLYAVDPGNTEIAFTIEYLSPKKNANTT